MGWGTDFTSNIYLNKQLFSNVFEVEDKVSELEDDKKYLETKLHMYSSSNVKDIVPRDWMDDDPISWLQKEVSQILQELNEINVELYKLGLYKEFLDSNKDVKRKERFIKIRF